MDLEGFIQDALRLLALGSGQDLLWSLFLYVIFILGLITLFLIPDKNLVATLLMAGVLLGAIVAKVSLASSQPIIGRTDFGMMVINVLMGAIPFIVAGVIRGRKSKAQPPAILTGICGFIYFIMFWLFVQRGA